MTVPARNRLLTFAILAVVCAVGGMPFIIGGGLQVGLNYRQAPDRVEAFCQTVVGHLKTGDFDALRGLVPEEVRKDPASLGQLRRLPGFGGPPAENSLILYRKNKSADPAGTVHILVYQQKIDKRYYVLQMSVLAAGGALQLTRLRLNEIPDSLRSINALARARPSWVRPLMLGLSVFFLTLSCAAFFLIFQVPRKDRWLWMVLVFLGIGGLQVNWTTLEFRSLFLVSLPFVRLTREGAYLPWIFSFTFPAGLFASGVYLWLTYPRKDKPGGLPRVG